VEEARTNLLLRSEEFEKFLRFFNPTEGAVFVDFKTTGVGIVLNIDNGGFPNRIQFSNTSGMHMLEIAYHNKQ
jgi:hypothetical protein